MKLSLKLICYSSIFLVQKRSIFSQFRTGILPLEIEAGRYIRKKLEDRVCKLCKLHLEDEINFLYVCPLLTTVRQKFLNQMNIPNFSTPLDVFLKIMNHENSLLPVNFVHEMWLYRSLLFM